MNDLLLKLCRCIHKQTNDCNISERNKYLEVNFISQKRDICQHTELINVLLEFPDRDDIEIEFNNSLEESLIISNKNNKTDENAFNDFFSELSEEDELDIRINVKKRIIDGVISVYSYEKFCEYISSLDIINVIEFIEEDLQDCEQLILEVYNKEVFWATKTIVARNRDNIYKAELFDRKKRIEECRKNNNVFWNGSILPIPDDFHFIIGNINNPFGKIFKKVETLLSVIYISDNARIVKENNVLNCELIGQRMNSYEIKIEDLKHNPILFDVYSWIYTEGNVVDKIIIVRNLLSMHCKYLSIAQIDEKTFGSIKVNYSLYQKQNVDNFIKLKNDMTKFISEAVNQSKEIVEKITEDIKKNIVAFLSFAFTIFISNIISEKGLENIFTKDITYLSYCVIVCSICFMIICYKMSEFSVNKVQQKYDMIKENNNFLKGSKEYEEIFDDRKMDSIKMEISEHRKFLFILWGIILLMIFGVIEIASDYSISKGILVKMIEIFSKLIID